MKILPTLLVAVAVAVVPVAAIAQDPAAPVTAVAGKTLFGAEGARLGAIYRVTNDGSAQLIVNGKLVTIPAATISDQGGKITTTMSRKDLRTAR